MIGDFIHNRFERKENDNAKASRQAQMEILRGRQVSTPKKSKKGQGNSKYLPSIDSGSPTKRDFKLKFKEFIGHFDHTPSFLQFNKNLHTGYRINFNTPGKVFRSLFMLHNESVNIWTHLCGGIVFMMISLALIFSVNSFDAHSIQVFVEDEVKSLFQPVFHVLPNFTHIEEEILARLHYLEEPVQVDHSEHDGDMCLTGDTCLAELEHFLHSISEEAEHIKENLNAEKIGKFLTKLKEELEPYFGLVKKMKNSIGLNEEMKQRLKEKTDALENKLNQLQRKLIKKIDSSDLDWIDIYKYIKPSYSSSLTSANNYRKVPVSRWPIIVFLLSAVFCLLCSAIYHGFYCMSHEADKLLSRLDYAGISLLITGSCFPPYIYGFYCQPFYSQLYLSIIGSISIVIFIVSLGDTIHKFEYTVHKTVMYGCLGIVAIAPTFHLVYLNFTSQAGSDNLDFLPSATYYIGMMLSYLCGMIIYATKYPECCNPGKFDLWGHSHQIWHCFVLLGIIFTYFGAFDNYYTRINIPCVGCEL